MINLKKENFLCKGCRHILNFEFEWKDHLKSYPEDKEKVLKRHKCLDCSINDEENKISLAPEDATFYCQKCKIYTNDKTLITGCIHCQTPLIRTNHEVVY